MEYGERKREREKSWKRMAFNIYILWFLTALDFRTIFANCLLNAFAH